MASSVSKALSKCSPIFEYSCRFELPVVANSIISLSKYRCSYVSMLLELLRILTCCNVETHSVPKAPVKLQTLVGLREVIMTSNLDGPVRKVRDGKLCSVPSCIDDNLFFPNNHTSRLSIVGNLLQNVIESQRSGNISALLDLNDALHQPHKSRLCTAGNIQMQQDTRAH